MKELKFPYPNIVKVLDQYYGVDTKSDTTFFKQGVKSILKELVTRKKVNNAPLKKKSLSILITTFWDYPHTGGLSNYITALRDGLRNLGHQVDVIAPNQFPEEKVSKIRAQIVPELKQFLNGRYGTYSSKVLQSMRLLFVYENMLKYIDLEKYDILHAQDLFTANILGRLNEAHGKPLIYTPHGMFTYNRLKFNRIEKGSVEEVYYEEMERKAVDYASHIINITDSFIPQLRKLGASMKKMTTIHTGIEYPHSISIRKPHDKIVISCVARLGPRKGQQDLLLAIANLKNITEDIDVLIIGDGDMREILEKQVEDLRVKNVYFLGSRDDVPYLLSITDIFVLPTLNDSLPLSIIEAMHSGTAIISTYCGGIPELIQHNETGILINPGDVNELTKQLEYLINSKTNRERLGNNAFAYAQKNLTLKEMLSRIENKYYQLTYDEGGK
ncbi:glycogen synthase [Lottiidibacillus patelloidae]|uniref:Glycogen synthase n=1 Tax=Lottiidibacillus patelloidae TaxID=2670334 RepID=A0A263BXP8_9BACI|nr:glycosyltransferase family 4 protein [Lottiidibacillus patelloidae]OZM58342.1 glycogen synthase [Lottiidibacillus patelloidae]